jgi:hypothetical protein
MPLVFATLHDAIVAYFHLVAAHTPNLPDIATWLKGVKIG